MAIHMANGYILAAFVLTLFCVVYLLKAKKETINC